MPVSVIATCALTTRAEQLCSQGTGFVRNDNRQTKEIYTADNNCFVMGLQFGHGSRNSTCFRKYLRPNMRVWSCLASVLVVYSAGVSSDECLNAVDIGDTDRRNESTRLPAYGPGPLCDAYFETDNWYYFGLGNRRCRMTEICAELRRCGTIGGIWLNGTHPTASDTGPVQRTVCSRNGNPDNCCHWSATISIKRCWNAEIQREYFVYKLARVSTTDCDNAYCISSDCGEEPIITTTPKPVETTTPDPFNTTTYPLKIATTTYPFETAISDNNAQPSILPLFDILLGVLIPVGVIVIVVVIVVCVACKRNRCKKKTTETNYVTAIIDDYEKLRVSNKTAPSGGGDDDDNYDKIAEPVDGQNVYSDQIVPTTNDEDKYDYPNLGSTYDNDIQQSANAIQPDGERPYQNFIIT